MAIVTGIQRKSGVYNGKAYDNYSISFKLDPVADYSDERRGTLKNIGGDMYATYSCSAVVFEDCLSACLLDKPADLIGKNVRYFIGRYNKLSGFLLSGV